MKSRTCEKAEPFTVYVAIQYLLFADLNLVYQGNLSYTSACPKANVLIIVCV